MNKAFQVFMRNLQELNKVVIGSDKGGSSKRKAPISSSVPHAPSRDTGNVRATATAATPATVDNPIEVEESDDEVEADAEPERERVDMVEDDVHVEENLEGEHGHNENEQGREDTSHDEEIEHGVNENDDRDEETEEAGEENDDAGEENDHTVDKHDAEVDENMEQEDTEETAVPSQSYGPAQPHSRERQSEVREGEEDGLDSDDRSYRAPVERLGGSDEDASCEDEEGADATEEEVEQLSSNPQKRKKVTKRKSTAKNRRVVAEVVTDGHPVTVPKKVFRHPTKTPAGKPVDIDFFQQELRQFKTRVSYLYIWGEEFIKDVSIEQMETAPNTHKYRPYHESLAETLLQVFLSQLQPNKQRLTLMPKTNTMSTTWEDVAAGQFYIINGQHSWAAAKRLVGSDKVAASLKRNYRTFQCDFVWGTDMQLLSELSRRTNNTNQHRWDSPEYLLHIKYARDLFLEYNRPVAPKVGEKMATEDRKRWKVFQYKAVETLNAMTFKHANKSAAEYVGELRIICGDDELYTSIMRAFQWYESGDLINPDTGNKWRDDAKPEWSRKYVVAYLFKCLRGLGRASIMEVAAKITAGLSADGKVLTTSDLPKIYVGNARPKNKFCFSLKEWTDRKKAKNAIVRLLHRQTAGGLWIGEDVDKTAWSNFKVRHGFNSAHMDELILRASRAYLKKFMKVSDNPKREQEPIPEAFRAEMNRVCAKHNVTRVDLTPALAVYLFSRSLTRFATRAFWSTAGSTSSTPPIQHESWKTVDPTQMMFVGGIIDFRPVDKFLLREDFVTEGPYGRCYEKWLKKFVDDFDFLHACPHWMVIAHANQGADALAAMIQYLVVKPGDESWDVRQSRYVLAAAESHFFSTSTLKKGNGVDIYILSAKPWEPLRWPAMVRSAETSKRFGHVREYGLYSHELRLEVYMDFLQQLPQENPGQNLSSPRSILCVTAGRKCMISSVMLGLRLVSVLLPTDDLHCHVISHRLGCQLRGFEHLFHTNYFVDDIVGNKDDFAEDNLGFAREWRTKRRQDVGAGGGDDGPAEGGTAVGGEQRHEDVVEPRHEGDEVGAAGGDDGPAEGAERHDYDEDAGAGGGGDGEADGAQIVEEHCDGGSDHDGGTKHDEEPTGAQTSMQETPVAKIFRGSQYAGRDDSLQGVIPETQLRASEEPTDCLDYTADSPGPNLYDDIDLFGSPVLASSAGGRCPLFSPQDDEGGNSRDMVDGIGNQSVTYVPSTYPEHDVEFHADVDRDRASQADDVPISDICKVVKSSLPSSVPAGPQSADCSPLGHAPAASVAGLEVLAAAAPLSQDSDMEDSIPLHQAEAVATTGFEAAATPDDNEDMQIEVRRPLVQGMDEQPVEYPDVEITRTRVEILKSIKAEPASEMQLAGPAAPSNKDDPIYVSTDEEDTFRETSKRSIPSEDESDISDIPMEDGADETKLSQAKALRIQLRAVTKKKLAVNRENRRKARELMTENHILQKQLQTERQLRDEERKRREEAEQTLRSAGLDSTLNGSAFTVTPSTRTTSMASAPAASVSEAIVRLAAEGAEDCIPATQESALLPSHADITPGKTPEGI